jgi:hypothetical protein
MPWDHGGFSLPSVSPGRPVPDLAESRFFTAKQAAMRRAGEEGQNAALAHQFTCTSHIPFRQPCIPMWNYLEKIR